MGLNDITCGSITAAELVTSSGGLTMGADQKITLPSSYTTLPGAGQLGYFQSVKNSGPFIATAGQLGKCYWGFFESCSRILCVDWIFI
jgi:hypothetical protein